MKHGAWLLAAALAIGVMLSPVRASADEPAKVGVVSHVLVLSDKCEDVSSPEAWKRTCIKDGMSGKDKALAVWKTVVKYRHQTEPPSEGIMNEEHVHDPFKTIHVYGYGQCCCAACNVEGLARYLGLDARGRFLNQHSVPEVKIDGEWALLDGSVMNYFIKDDGKLAGVDDIREAVRGWFEANPELAKQMRGNDAALRKFALNEGWKKGPALLAKSEWYTKDGPNPAGWHGWPSTMQEYDWSKERMGVYDYGPSMGYQLNVQLRKGEKLTRCWSSKGLVLNGAAADLIQGGRKGLDLQRRFGDLAPGRVGNGTLVYDVPLATGEFRLGALAAETLATGAEDKDVAVAVHVKDPSKPGELVIRMPTSYVYLTGEMAIDAAVGEGGSVDILFSNNHGMDWRKIETLSAGGAKTIDLKDKVHGLYDYRVKFVMKGKGTGLNALKFSHDVQHSQAPLPLLLEGDNTITFSAGPPEGTITYEPRMDPAKARGNAVPHTAFHPRLEDLAAEWLRVGDSGKGTAVYALSAPGEIVRVRMNAHYRARDLAGKDGFKVELSFDGGESWKPAETWDKAQPASSKYSTFTDVPAGAKDAQVRLSGYQQNTACIFDLRFDVDYKEPHGGFRPVKVTYVWDEAGREKTDVHVARTPQDAWKITCGPKAVARSFTVEPAE